MRLSDDAYVRLLAFRTGLRHFERWSAQQARAARLTSAQHQLLLAIRGHPDPSGPTIGELADYLMLRHHSAVGLVDRAEAAGLVRRDRSEADHRVVFLRLTGEGARRLEALTALHLEELKRLTTDVTGIWDGLAPVQRPHGFPGHLDEPVNVGIARVDEEPAPGAIRILVDRRWPRGVPRSDASFAEWFKNLAPSGELGDWYRQAHRQSAVFALRYREELAKHPAKEALAALRSRARTSPVVLVTAAKDLDRSGAAVLRDVLAGR